MQYILFGAGRDGRGLLSILGKEKVAYFCDSNLSLHRKNIDGVEVISYETLKRLYRGYSVVISTRKMANIITLVHRLINDGIPFSFMDELAAETLDKDRELYQALNKRSSFDYQVESAYFIPFDKYKMAGTLGSYFWQDLWAAQHIFKARPPVHYDIGSRIDGFIAHLASFGQKVRLLDIRPLEATIPEVEFIQCDATNLESVADNSLESLSALCSLEHFGLGRYGDPIDPEACFKCFAAIQRKMSPGGLLYVSVPVGKEHIEFNAHRVFYASTIVDNFSEMKLLEYSSAYKENIDTNIDLHRYDDWMEWGGDRFGLFMFQKV